MSVYDDIQTAAVIRYPYLWAREAGKGETEGRKERPVAVGVRIPSCRRRSGPVLPDHDQAARTRPLRFRDPNDRKRRAGLDADRQLWIMMDEYNSDLVGASFYLEPEPPIGRFSKAFFLPILREFIARRKSFSEVSRHR